MNRLFSLIQSSIKMWTLIFFLLASYSSAQDSSLDKSPLPKPSSPVVDYAGVLDPQSKKELINRLNAFRQTSSPSVEIGVAIIKTTGETPIFEYSMAVARGWGIGSREEDNPGALLLVAVDDRRYYTVVSRDLEDELPDGLVGSIQRKYLVPQFRVGNYSKGIGDTIRVYIQTIEKSRGTLSDSSSSGTAENIEVPNAPLPKTKHLVNDFYGILETPVKTVMNRHLLKFRDSTKPPVSIYVAIIETTDGIPIAPYTLAAAKGWNLDTDEAAKNVLLLVSMDDQTYSTYVSPALKNKLPAAYTRGIQERFLGRAFSPFSGEYNAAISEIVNAYVRAIDRSQPKIDFTKGNLNGFRGYDGVFHYALDNWMMILVTLIGLMILGLFIYGVLSGGISGGGSGGSSGGYSGTTGWEAGSFSTSSNSWDSSSSDSFGGFGGGGDFGGGGAGGSW